MVAKFPMIKRVIKLLISQCIYGIDYNYRSCFVKKYKSAISRGIVLYYHNISKSQKDAFAKQMDILLRLACPWDLNNTPPESKKTLVAVTFDDGYVSVFENALPELKKRNIPITIFIPTGLLGKRPEWVKSNQCPSWEEYIVSRNELKNIASEPLITIGSHTISHSNLLKISLKEAIRELVSSKAELEDLLSRPIEFLSFPYGAYNTHLVELALKVGYRCLFTIEPKIINPHQLGTVNGRVGVNPEDWLLEFKLKALGAYSWHPWLYSFKRRILSVWGLAY